MNKLVFEPEIYTFNIDAARHVSNIAYIQWLEIGRLKLLEAVDLPIDELERQGIAPVITRTRIHYIHPLYLGDRVRIEIFLSKLRKISGRLKFVIYRGDDEIVAEAEQETAFFDLESKHPYHLTTEQHDRFIPYLMKK